MKSFHSTLHYKSLALCLTLVLTLGLSPSSEAQVPVEASPNQALLLQSQDPQLAANKRLVSDFWREVLEAGHLDLAEKYLTETYIQHNPNVPTGRAGFIQYFSAFAKAKPIQPHIQAPLVSIVAEGDMVVLSFVQKINNPKDPSKKATTTWFDMFRIENGKIAEHWDSALLNP
jgi:predicted SnoaL-like aldol condensation-catalyzing enzyme